MAIGLLDPGSQQLNQTQVVTATGTNDTFTFQSPPPGLQWTGTLQCASAPTGAVFAAVIGGTSWGEWGGNSVYGPVQAQATQQLVVTVNGLVAGQVYVLLWIGSSDPSHLVQPLYPSANSTALFAQVNAPAAGIMFPSTVVGTGGGTTSTTPVTLSATIRTIIITLSATSSVTNVTVTGLTSGFVYYQASPYLKKLGAFIYTVVIPVDAVVDPAVNVYVQTFAAGTVTMEVFGDTPQYDESVFYNGTPTTVGVVNPTSGTVLATGPCRLLHVWMECTAAQSASIQGAGGALLRITAGLGTYRDYTPPQPFIIQDGTTVVTATGTATSAGVVVAYP